MSNCKESKCNEGSFWCVCRALLDTGPVSLRDAGKSSSEKNSREGGGVDWEKCDLNGGEVGELEVEEGESRESEVGRAGNGGDSPLARFRNDTGSVPCRLSIGLGAGAGVDSNTTGTVVTGDLFENGSGSRLKSDSIEIRDKAVVDLFRRVRLKILRFVRIVVRSVVGRSWETARRGCGATVKSKETGTGAEDFFERERDLKNVHLDFLDFSGTGGGGGESLRRLSRVKVIGSLVVSSWTIFFLGTI